MQLEYSVGKYRQEIKRWDWGNWSFQWVRCMIKVDVNWKDSDLQLEIGRVEFYIFRCRVVLDCKVWGVIQGIYG